MVAAAMRGREGADDRADARRFTAVPLRSALAAGGAGQSASSRATARLLGGGAVIPRSPSTTNDDRQVRA